MIMDNGMGRIPVEWAGTDLMCGSKGPALRVCGQGLWGQMSENTNSA